MQSGKKRGRPPSDEPKSEWLHMRLSVEEEKILTNYCEKHNTKRPDAVREAIQRLNDRDQSYFLTAEWREKLGKFENELNHGAEQVTQAVQLMMDLLHEMNQAIKQRSDEHEKK